MGAVSISNLSTGNGITAGMHLYEYSCWCLWVDYKVGVGKKQENVFKTVYQWYTFDLWDALKFIL